MPMKTSNLRRKDRERRRTGKQTTRRKRRRISRGKCGFKKMQRAGWGAMTGSYGVPTEIS